ncbi:hypothetical protein SLA2020_505070 [Shorea laevis]
MGSGTVHMMHNMFIIFMLLLSLKSTSVLIADASLDAAEEFSKLHGLQQFYFMEERGRNQNGIQKVSGKDENEQKASLILQKFRDLLGIKRFRRTPPSWDAEPVSPSPSPSPSIAVETPSRAPAPAMPFPAHAHPHSPRSNPHHHKIQKKSTEKGRVRRVLVPVIVSAGAAFVACALGLLCICRKFRRNGKKSAKTMSQYSKKGRIRFRGKSKHRSSQNSSSKVSLNPSVDLFYLSSLGVDLEQQTTCYEQTTEIVNASPSSSNLSPPGYTLHEGEGSKKQLITAESDIASSSSTKEIMSVHEDVESVRYESDGGNFSSDNKIIPIECHSSDDESFHSFGDSNSSQVRLSNASAGSLSDATENPSNTVPKISTTPLHSSACSPVPQATPEHISVHCDPDCQNSFRSPPPPPTPPPPPPLPPNMHRSPLYSSSSSSPQQSLTPSRKPDSLLGSNINQAQQSDSPPSPQIPSGPTLSPRIPPPPRPPSFLKRNDNSVKGPPPLPSQFPPYAAVGKDGAPLPKLKPLYWDKVRAAPNRSMVWDKLRSSSFELDEEMIESLFGYNIQNSTKNDESQSKTPSPSKQLLEPKRLQNITILLKALNATAEKVCDALMQGDGLVLQQLEALVKMVPTKEEEGKLSSYKGNINELGSAEKFVKVLLGIPFAFLRAEAMLYRETFEDEVVHLKNSFSMLEEACKELRSSRLFLKLLEAVLKTGNRMNVGTIRGGARAFKLDALLKLSDVKGTDGKTTLLHFVVQEIIRSEGIRVSDSIMGKINQKNKAKTVEEKEEDYRRMGLDLVSGLTTELYHVKKTATLDLDVLASSVSNLYDGMSKLKHLVQQALSADDEKGMNFINSMNSFMNHAEKNLKELKEDEDRVLLHVREITEYFHGDVSKDEANPLRIFVIVRDFLGMLDQVCKELRSSRVPSSPNPLAPFR